MKILLLGSSGAGKTSLAVMFERKYFLKTYEQTVVLQTHTREVFTCKNICFYQCAHIEIKFEEHEFISTTHPRSLHHVAPHHAHYYQFFFFLKKKEV